MRITFSIDRKLVGQARKKASSLGKTLNQMIRDHLFKLAQDGECEKSIAEFMRLSGKGHSQGWRFNRDEIHKRS
jgi:hypothetical protein